MKFTERFNEALKASGMRQTEIAQYLGISKQCVNDYKTGKSVPSIETLFNLCKCLEVSADYLLGLVDY